MKLIELLPSSASIFLAPAAPPSTARCASMDARSPSASVDLVAKAVALMAATPTTEGSSR